MNTYVHVLSSRWVHTQTMNEYIRASASLRLSLLEVPVDVECSDVHLICRTLHDDEAREVHFVATALSFKHVLLHNDCVLLCLTCGRPTTTLPRFYQFQSLSRKKMCANKKALQICLTHVYKITNERLRSRGRA